MKNHPKQKYLDKCVYDMTVCNMKEMCCQERIDSLQEQLKIVLDVKELKSKKFSVLIQPILFFTSALLDLILVFCTKFPLFLALDIIFFDGYSSENKREYHQLKKSFFKQYPSEKYLLKKSYYFLIKRIFNINEQIYYIKADNEDCHLENELNRKKYTLLENSTNISFKKINEMKELSSCSAKPPLSSEQLKIYRDLLIHYTNVSYTQSLDNEEIKQKVKLNN